MPKIGIIYGTENTFPGALVDCINGKHVAGVVAEHVKIGAARMAEPSGYRVIIDRISQDIEFYQAYLKNAMLNGTIVINNPFWWSADDDFFNHALASKLGVAVPRTVVLPHKQHPPGTSVQSMRNLVYPLDWDAIFHYVGFPAYLKPFGGHGWSHIYKVQDPEELFTAYDETGTLCMVLQQAIEFEEYFRCYVVGQEQVRVMPYDPRRPHSLRYARDGSAYSRPVNERMVKDSLTLCRALGYDFNCVEFAVQGGVPYAIDFLNPAPDADLHSVGQDNFDWIVENIAQLAITKAMSDEQPHRLYRWSAFLDPEPTEPKETA
jgi:glutathione synthase/RimK-type ligase-like ATP-grasp enzyme